MPICRHQIRGEFGLADPELYRAADRDDPEAVLEGVAMAGLVGVLRQLGDLAEFAAEIFHDLHEEVMATAARGHGLMLRVQQLEEELPSMEKTFLSQNSQLLSASTAGFEWHANLRLEQSLVATGDLPRFIMDSYEECRGPPRLFLLDKFDVAGAGACLKRYSDPSFFKTEFSSTGTMKADVPREKKIRKFKAKGLFYKDGNTSDFISSTEFSSMLQDGMLNEPSNVSGKNTFHLVKLKRRNFIDSSFSLRNKKLLMEQIFKVTSPELKPVYEKSLVYSSLGAASIDNDETHDEIFENSIMELGTKEIPVGLTDKSTSIEYNHELVRWHSMNDPLDSANDVIKEEKVPSLPEASPKNVIHDGYNSDSNTSGVDNFMDALATMDSELETSLQNRLQHEKSLLSIPSRALDSDSNDDQTELRGLSSDSYSAGSSSVSYEWKEALKKNASSNSASDTASSVDELFSEYNSSRLNIPCDKPSSSLVNSHHDKRTIAVEIPKEASLRVFHEKNTSEHLEQIVVSPQTLSNSVENHTLNVSPFPVDSQHGVLASAVEIPNETSSTANCTSDHSEQLLVSPQESSSSNEDHKIDLSPCAKEVNERIFGGSQNQPDSSSCFSATVGNTQTSGIVEKIGTSMLSTLEDNAGDNQNSLKSYETHAGVDLVSDPNPSDYFVNQLMENNQPMESALSQKEYNSLCSPENDNANSLGLSLFEKKDITHFPKVEQSMNIGEGNKMISVGEQKDSCEPELAFSSNSLRGEGSSQVLTDKSERIYFHELLKDQSFSGNFELLDETALSKVCSVPEVPISVDEELEVKTNTNLHETDDTCACDIEVPSSLSARLPLMPSSDNDTRYEYSGEGISDPQKLETSELSSLELINSSNLHEVDPVITNFLDGTGNESKAEEGVPPVMKENRQDTPVVDQPLSGSTVLMNDLFILDSNSGSADRSCQLVSEGHFYSLNTLEAPTPLTQHQETESLQDTRPCTADSSDTACDLMIDDETRLKSKTVSVDPLLPTSLPVLPKNLSEQEPAKENSESAIGSRLEYLCEDLVKVESSECTVEIVKAESSNHVSEKPSDLISSMQSAEDIFQASDVDQDRLGHHVDEACQQNHGLPNGRHMKGSEDVKVVSHLLDENDQLSESPLSHGNFEHTQKLGQILKIQISDEMSQDKLDDVVSSEYSFQAMKQTSKKGNSSGADDNDYGAQTVQLESETVPAHCVEPLAEKVSGRLHQHTRGEPCERLDSISRGDLDVPSTSGHPIQSFIPVMSSSGAFPGVGLLQSTNPTSSDRDTMPPLPPLPPLQWISGKFPLGPSSMSFSSPFDAPEDCGPHVSQAFSDPKSLSFNSNVEDRRTKEAPNSQRLVKESRIVEYDPLGMEEHTSIAVDPSPGHEEAKHGSNHVAEQNAPGVLPKQTGTNDESHPTVVTYTENVGPSLNALSSVWIEENERPVSRMVIPRHKDDPLIEAVAAHDRSKLRKVSELDRLEIKPKTDDRNSFLEQIRNKSFNLKPAASARPSIQGPRTNLNVVAILEKANAIRQAFAGSDDEDDDADTWSEN